MYYLPFKSENYLSIVNTKLIVQGKRPICSICETRPCRENGISKNGFIKYQKYCTTCRKAVYNQTNGAKTIKTLGYKLHKKGFCETCGFIPIDPCQLDVDHIDSDGMNNDPDNLQTLCANCHRLKTHNDRNKKGEKILAL